MYTIINSATEKFYTTLVLMAETAVEGEELHKTKRNQINTQEGTISIIGTKGHANGTYKLSAKLAENPRLYLSNAKKSINFQKQDT